MTRFVPLRRALPLALALALAPAIAAPGAAFAQGAAPPAGPATPADRNKLHMDNGVKLYSDHNYPAAVAEFQAAYEARPNANPLVNIALCDKEMFRYPQAIAALEEALDKHGTSMDPADRKAAADAIKEMRDLLGTVTLSVTPRGAVVSVDGEDLPPGAADKPLHLGPGSHKIAARAPGHAPAEQRVTLTSGREVSVTLELAVESGLVTVEAPDARTWIAIDDVPRGAGTWSGPVPVGPHTVSMRGPDGAPFVTRIQVAAGVPQTVRRSEPGPAPAREPSHRGFYVLGLASLLTAVTHPPEFGAVDVPDYGAAYGLRAGFQVNKVAGFDLSYEHSSISSYAAGTGASAAQSNNYRIIADRLVVGLRLISPGTTVRFVSNLAGGFVNDQMSVVISTPIAGCLLKPDPANQNTPTCFLSGNHVGVDALALVEAGLEVDIDRVLLDFCAEGQVQSTGNLQGLGNLNLFGTHPLINAGAALRVGYRFW